MNSAVTRLVQVSDGDGDILLYAFCDDHTCWRLIANEPDSKWCRVEADSPATTAPVVALKSV